MDLVSSLTESERWAYGLVVTAIVAAFVAPFITHKLAVRRDRRSAKENASATSKRRVVGRDGTAISGDVNAGTATIVTGHRSQVTLKLALGKEPIEKTPELGGYMTAGEAIRYIAEESEWGIRLRSFVTESGMRLVPRFAAAEEFARAARAGEISVRGRASRGGEHQQISELYWLNATVDPASILSPSQAGATSSASPDRDERERFVPYDALGVKRSEVDRIWPRPSQSMP
jgi:hypothetical protein